MSNKNNICIIYKFIFLFRWEYVQKTHRHGCCCCLLQRSRWPWMISWTAVGSSIVLRSPKPFKSRSTTFRSTRRIILPERVFGRRWTNCENDPGPPPPKKRLSTSLPWMSGFHWTLMRPDYLDAVWRGILGDLFRHYVVKLPRHVHLLNVHALF